MMRIRLAGRTAQSEVVAWLTEQGRPPVASQEPGGLQGDGWRIAGRFVSLSPTQPSIHPLRWLITAEIEDPELATEIALRWGS